MDNISLELTVHWLSKDVVKFEVNVGFMRNMQKCNSDFGFLALQAADCNSKLTWLMSKFGPDK